jgi:hypothetical protein
MPKCLRYSILPAGCAAHTFSITSNHTVLSKVARRQSDSRFLFRPLQVVVCNSQLIVDWMVANHSMGREGRMNRRKLSIPR